MTYIHKEMAAGRWFEFSLMEQLANVGSEIERTINWRNKGDMKYSNNAFERGLELLDLTIADKKNSGRLKELTRLREVLVDYFFGDNQYSSSDRLWQKYFYYYNYAARINC
ncbi:hypothetical protein KJ840_00290 [Patescibacteria group bacterium]|nr:hypothetical protein [Patescibacteria group bacterium]